MIRWEYVRTMSYIYPKKGEVFSVEQHMNQMGAQGWELVSVQEGENNSCLTSLYWKRLVSQDKPCGS